MERPRKINSKLGVNIILTITALCLIVPVSMTIFDNTVQNGQNSGKSSVSTSNLAIHNNNSKQLVQLLDNATPNTLSSSDCDYTW